MKIIYLSYKTFLIAAILLALSSCKDGPNDCFKSTGGNETESRPVSDFTDIYIYNNPDVVITQDTVNSVVVSAGDHLQSEIKITVADGTLKIENDNICNWVRSYKRRIIVYVHVKNLISVNHYGSGNITSSNTIQSDSLLANNRTSGNITLLVNSRVAYAQTHVSTGNVTLSGTTDNLYVYDICEGIIHCESLIANSVNAACKGTGNCYVYAANYLSTEIRGLGYIYYYGNPSITQNINTGAGQLVHVQ